MQAVRSADNRQGKMQTAPILFGQVSHSVVVRKSQRQAKDGVSSNLRLLQKGICEHREQGSEVLLS
jgi:hypothetical protein